MKRDLYGLIVECDTSQTEDFAALRALIEPSMRKLLQILEQGKHTGQDSNFVKVPGDNPYYLSFCIAGKQIVFGLYDKNLKTVSGSCNYGDIKELGVSEVNRLINIMENYLKNNIRMPSLNALEKAWIDEMFKRREKEKEIKKPENVLEYDIFAKRLAGNRAPPKEKKAVPNINRSGDAR